MITIIIIVITGPYARNRKGKPGSPRPFPSQTGFWQPVRVEVVGQEALAQQLTPCFLEAMRHSVLLLPETLPLVLVEYVGQGSQ